MRRDTVTSRSVTGIPAAMPSGPRVKSRPSFRPILADRLPATPPAPSYANLDF